MTDCCGTTTSAAFDVSVVTLDVSSANALKDDTLPDGTAIAPIVAMAAIADKSVFLIFMLYSSPGRE